MKAILKYPGGKWRIADWIISQFPTHKVYCEPFFGSGGVFFNKSPSAIETINDIDGNVVNLFKVCRERPAELAAALAFTPWAREEYISCYNMTVGNEIERARRTAVRFHQSYGTSNSSRASWRNVQTAGGPKVAAQWRELPEIVLNVCERLKDAQIENIDALTLIERYNHPDTLLYIDPPYLQSLRKHNLYKHDMQDSRHIELLKLLKANKSKICLSAYDSKLYNDMLEDWYKVEKETIAQKGLHRTEKLYMNYAPDLMNFNNL